MKEGEARLETPPVEPALPPQSPPRKRLRVPLGVLPFLSRKEEQEENSVEIALDFNEAEQDLATFIELNEGELEVEPLPRRSQPPPPPAPSQPPPRPSHPPPSEPPSAPIEGKAASQQAALNRAPMEDILIPASPRLPQEFLVTTFNNESPHENLPASEHTLPKEGEATPNVVEVDSELESRAFTTKARIFHSPSDFAPPSSQDSFETQEKGDSCPTSSPSSPMPKTSDGLLEKPQQTHEAGLESASSVITSASGAAETHPDEGAHLSQEEATNTPSTDDVVITVSDSEHPSVHRMMTVVVGHSKSSVAEASSQSSVEPKVIQEDILGITKPAATNLIESDLIESDEPTISVDFSDGVPLIGEDEITEEFEAASPSSSSHLADEAPPTTSPQHRLPPKPPPSSPPQPSQQPTAALGESQAEAARRPWWEEVFDDDYFRIHPHPHPQKIARETDFIESRLSLDKGAKVLDLACGLGLHAIEMSKRGHTVVGLDLSSAMLRRAVQEAKDQDVPIKFLQGDMRDLAFSTEFDAILLWGSSFGYFDDDTNRQVLERIHRALKPGGFFLIDIPNRDYIIREMPHSLWFQGDGCIVMEEAYFNYLTSRLVCRQNVMFEGGRQRQINCSIRLYSLHEIGQLLNGKGFRVIEVSGREATPGEFFGINSPRLIILSQRRTTG
ncbi:MAG: class I SAM-dependent methyltransferase [Sandaracinaceae bacterium]|nr:class I SAM-dependent methyltransferase [Sandaracinaceae bacterium]